MNPNLIRVSHNFIRVTTLKKEALRKKVPKVGLLKISHPPARQRIKGAPIVMRVLRRITKMARKLPSNETKYLKGPLAVSLIAR